MDDPGRPFLVSSSTWTVKTCNFLGLFLHCLNEIVIEQPLKFCSENKAIDADSLMKWATECFEVHGKNSVLL